MKFIQSYSGIVTLALCILFVALVSISPPGNILSWDVFGYYLYLPLTFIHQDIKFTDPAFVQSIIDTYQSSGTFYQAHQAPETGNFVIQYTMGLSLLYLPFFLLGHAFALMTGAPADGFSAPYQVAIICSSLFYTCLGLFLMRKVLLHFFTDRITALTLLIIALGTNYYHLNGYNTGMSHNYLFGLYALLLWLTILWHKKPGIWLALGLGTVMGLAVLSRPSEIVIVFIPLLWGVYNRTTLEEKVRLLLKHWQSVAAIGVVMFVVGFPQLLYWKYLSGQWLFNSYQNPGEGLDLLSPHFGNLLFSFRKGWLIYTPIMGLALLGFISLYQRKRDIFFPVLAFFCFNLYLVSSWSNWWYADSFSQRSMMQSYAFMALPLGALLLSASHSSRIRLNLLGVATILLVALNQFQTWQINNGILHTSRMTRPYYFATFLKTSVPEGAENLLLINRSYDGEEKIPEHLKFLTSPLERHGYETSKDPGYSQSTTQFSYQGSRSLKITKEAAFSPAIKAKYSDLTDGEYAWVRVGMWIYPTDKAKNKISLITTFDHKGKSYKYRSVDTENEELALKDNQWNYVEMDYLTPEIRRVEDELKVYVWMRGEGEVYVDELNVTVWNLIK